MSAVEFMVKVVDRATGPLKGIQDAIKRVSHAGSSLKVSAPNIPSPETGGFLSRISGMVGNAKASLANMGHGEFFKKLETTGTAAFAKIGAAASTVTAIIEGVGQVASFVGGALSALGNGVLSVSKFAVSAAGFKGDTLLALKYIMGGKENADKAYKLISTMADISPMTDRQMVDMFQKLKGSGYSTSDTAKIAAAMADLSVASTDPSKLQSVVLAMTKIKGAGKMDTESLTMMFEGSGGIIDVGSFKQSLAKVTGKKAGDITKMIESGKVTSDMAQKAFFDVIRKKFYHGDPKAIIGTAADEKSRTLGGQLSTLEGKMQRLFADVNIAPLANAIGVLNDALSDTSPGAKLLKAAIEDFFGAFFGGAAGMKGSDLSAIFAKAAPVIHTLANGVRMVGNVLWNVVLPAGKAAFGTMTSILGTTLAPLGNLISALFGINGAGAGVVALTAVFRLLAIGISVVVTIIAYIAVAIGAVAGAVYGVAGVFITGFMGLADGAASAASAIWAFGGEFVSAGYNLIMGLVDGISSGAGAAVAKINEVGEQIVQAAKSVFQTHSPSLVFADIGGNVSAGLAVGMDQQAPKAQKSLLRLVHSVKDEGKNAESAFSSIRPIEVKPELQQAVRATGQPQQVQAQGERGGSQYTFNITVNGGDESVAAKIKAAVLEALREVESGEGAEVAA